MGTWNVRILHRLHENGEHELFPAEVHYADYFAFAPSGYGEFNASGDSIADVRFYAIELLRACDKPILEGGQLFPKEYKP